MPDLAAFLPVFYGTLQLGNQAVAQEAADATPAASTAPEPGTAATLGVNDIGPMKGKKISTDSSIVLENIAGGFKKPNILDIKLGARLWDDKAKPEKRARLDKVANETTSGSLGFRIAGMRVWKGEGVDAKPTVKIGGETKDDLATVEPSGYKVFNKIYGRAFTAENVIEGFEEFLRVPSAGIDDARSARVVEKFLNDVKKITKVFEGIESRMYSASILFVYEGDPAAFDAAAAYVPKEVSADEDEEVDEEEEPAPKIAATKLIDFAHASLVPGEGPDENALRGIRSAAKILEDLSSKLQS